MPDAKTVDLTYAGWMVARFSSQGPDGPPGEPRAEQHVLARTFHGVSLNDEFDWLKAANWREVMRDPLKLDWRSAHICKPKRIIANARSARLQACSKRCSRK